MKLIRFKLPSLTPPAREAVVVPDQRFFLRVVELDVEAGPAREQIELALEELAPFALNSMWWGYWTASGCDHALVFATYQKRFRAEDTESWAEAEWVGPRLTCLLGQDTPAPAATWMLHAPEGLTLVHFGDGSGVPTLVRSVELPEEVSDSAIAAARDALIKSAGGSRDVRDIKTSDITAGVPGADELTVAVDDAKPTAVPLARAAELDVRDNDELASRRRARVRDRWMWRGLVAATIALLLGGLAEITLWGLNRWRDGMAAQIAAQTPLVAEIETADRLAQRINELHTQRMRPFEMIALADGPRPESVIFLSTAATGLYTMEIEAETDDAPSINAYVAALQALSQTEGVDILNLDTRGSRSTVRVSVRFTPDAFAGTGEVEGGTS